MPPTPASTSQPTIRDGDLVRKYKPGQVDRDRLIKLCEERLNKTPFSWQLDAAEHILQGEDLILDVGTGNGKTLVFSLPLLLNDTDINLIISPLSALMIDQAETASLSTVAVCTETIKEVGRDIMFESIVRGDYRQIIVSPEIATSPTFRTGVLSKPEFRRRIRTACLDEAHCISLWGGSFRKDYGELGVLRGRLPNHVCMVAASATLPDHVLDDIRAKIHLTKEAATVSLTNDRPNVALSARVMKHSDNSKADLRILIPETAKTPADVPVTLVYCNERSTTEDMKDRLQEYAKQAGFEDTSFIGYYHAKIGTARKRELEEKLRKGEIRILICTDAVGMGCDMRNIERVVLWGIPPSFCALAQRAGRAARDMTQSGDAIVIISTPAHKKSLTESEVMDAVSAAADAAEATNVGEEEEDLVEDELGMEVDEGGVRVSQDLEEEAAEAPNAIQAVKRRRLQKEINSREAKYLSLFLSGSRCRRAVWDEFFRNDTKKPLSYPSTTTYQKPPDIRCCDICTPDRFFVPKITLNKQAGLTRGRKKKVDDRLALRLRQELQTWRNKELLESYYPTGAVLLSGAALLGDDVIERIISCGNRILSLDEMKKNIRWYLAFSLDGALTPHGQLLLTKLKDIYDAHDTSIASVTEPPVASTSAIPPERFYAPARTRQSQTRGGGESEDNVSPAEQSDSDAETEGQEPMPSSGGRGRGRARGRGRGDRGRGSRGRTRGRARGSKGRSRRSRTEDSEAESEPAEVPARGRGRGRGRRARARGQE